ncbi:hypothetical protein SSX86_002020 [Deinandra increscens subsp. villosa]|uniref:Reverse transcriptase domain-containing protein n=1 Tax=Deinandra increscens subsp. villosa TaxID=3103831 RepID=A0AAP0DVL3_9ASTR
MDWLAKHKARIMWKEKTVVIKTPNGSNYTRLGDQPATPTRIISMLKAEKCLNTGCQALLVSLVEITKEKRLEDVSVVLKYANIFPEDLPGFPPKRQVEFPIELVPGTAPIGKAPYRLAPSEMQELRSQLQELLDKGLIIPSASPWGVPVLFVKKKDESMRMCINY